MNVGKFLSSYLKADDIKDPQVVTIAKTLAEEIGRDDTKESKLVVYFKEIEKGVVLNKTGIRTLSELFGSEDSDKWIGKKVTLYNDRNVMFQGKRCGGIRFKSAA